MELSNREFRAMNNSFRRLLQRAVEFPIFQQMGLADDNLDILEIGCGSGYGAELLARLRPHSYVGVDLMPEQIALATRRAIPNADFRVHDATDLGFVPDAGKDAVVIFGVLHHIPPWREVLAECYRVLRPGGRLFVEEPDGAYLEWWDRVFRWGHPARFTLRELEQHLASLGFEIGRRRFVMGFGVYCARK
jgi:SAM-dependent methyltransferase